jgi:hypothetical protein
MAGAAATAGIVSCTNLLNYAAAAQMSSKSANWRVALA